MPNPDSPWKNHRNAKPESRWERVTGSLGAGNRNRTEAWDRRGMDAVAGVRRKNLAPRPGSGMGGGRVTRSYKPTAEEKRQEQAARRAERAGRTQAKQLRRIVGGIADQQKIVEDPGASPGARRRAAQAVARGRRTAARVARNVAPEYIENVGVDESSWRRR